MLSRKCKKMMGQEATEQLLEPVGQGELLGGGDI